MKKAGIVNIVIDYANEDEVIGYAKQLKKQTVDVKLIVVINKVGEKGIEYLEQQLESLAIVYEIYNPEDNLGYLNGLVYGYKSTLRDSLWYVFSNTDIFIERNDFFEKFLQSKEFSLNEVWMVGPSVYTPYFNKYSNPYFTERPLKKFYMNRIIAMRFSGIFDFLHGIKNKLKRSDKNSKKQKSRAVYAVHGSFMFLRKELLDILVKREPWELLFDEEQYLAEIVRFNKRLVYYDSNIEVHHLEGASTGKVNLKKKYGLMIKANKRLLRDFYN